MTGNVSLSPGLAQIVVFSYTPVLEPSVTLLLNKSSGS
jgi:hypothetical protein